MYGKKRKKTRKTWKATLIIAVAIMLFSVGLGGTLAFLFTKTETVVNTFTSTYADIEIDEEFDGVSKKSIVIRNTGDVAVYFRVALVSNMTDDESAIIPDSTTLNPDLGTNWVKGNDGYYYYTKEVKGKSEDSNGNAIYYETDNMLNTPLQMLENQTITVLVQSIQSMPNTAVNVWNNDQVDVIGNNGTLSIKNK